MPEGIPAGIFAAAVDTFVAGQRLGGPAVIEGYTATTWVPPGWTATVDEADNLILRRAS